MDNCCKGLFVDHGRICCAPKPNEFILHFENRSLTDTVTYVFEPTTGRSSKDDTTAPTTFSGTWSGTYTNSRKEPGTDTTSLVETGGKVEGTEGGLKILDGRRIGNTMTWRLERDGGFAKGGCSWTVTVQIMDDGNTLVAKYTGHDHRTDKDGGTYTGVATLHKK